ncbi:fibronectin type III domain protein [Actinoplanes teichomyceticus]|uniref:Fibronectin type III domain protein n=1 Tax=Actinoplanes teichomyceticus TaxID=1867 RepID=A0A561WKE4_ACTTI|nr:fibronectin type III domain protein [Actinoplanes teichomyceticus]
MEPDTAVLPLVESRAAGRPEAPAHSRPAAARPPRAAGPWAGEPETQRASAAAPGPGNEPARPVPPPGGRERAAGQLGVHPMSPGATGSQWPDVGQAGHPEQTGPRQLGHHRAAPQRAPQPEAAQRAAHRPAGQPGVRQVPAGPAGVHHQAQAGGYAPAGVYHRGEGGVWQQDPATTAARDSGTGGPASYPKGNEPEPAGTRRRGMALFAVIAATLAAIVAVAAMVFTLAHRGGTGERTDTPPGAPTVAGAPPGDVRLADRGTEIEVSWSDPTRATVSFMITMAHPGEQLKPVKTVGPGQTSNRIEGLNPSLDYCFAVVAVYATDRFAASPQQCTDRGKN